MWQKNKTKNQRGVVTIVLIIAGVLILIGLILLIAAVAMVPFMDKFLAGIRGGLQPGGSYNAECGFDESKLSLYENGDAPGVLATSEEAKNFAINTLGVDPSRIKEYSKAEVENLIRAEIAKQWPQVTNKHGATQADAQHAILAYQYHEDASFQMFTNKGGRLVTKKDGPGLVQLLSISHHKWSGNKRKEIALHWDIKYVIYTGVKENISAFLNNSSGSGLNRWHEAIGHVFLPRSPNCYWNCSEAVCRCKAAQEGWDLYRNETEYRCAAGSGSVVAVAQSQIGYKPSSENCSKYNSYPIGGSRCYAWCAAFVTWVYNEAGFTMEKTAGTHRMMDLFKNGHTYVVLEGSPGGTIPLPGDAFWMRSSAANSGYHVGIVERFEGGRVYTIEGNTDDDKVLKREHNINEIYALGRW